MSLLSLSWNGKPAGEVTIRPSIPLDRALLCVESGCESIYEADGEPACPACGSRQAVLLARTQLNRPATPAQATNEPTTAGRESGEGVA